jgi:hypothetical protein
MENSTQNNPQARSEIPDIWGQNGHCPVCSAKPLYVRHLDSGPDFLLCQKCELSFEVAQSGGNIRVKNIPEDLGFAEERLRFRWIAPQFLRTLVEERDARRRALAQDTITPPQANLEDIEVWERTLSLHKIGNSPKKIKYILLQAGATPRQTELSLKKLEKEIKTETTQQSKKLLWLGSGVLVIFALVFTGIFSFQNQIAARLEAGAAGKITESESVIPIRDVTDMLPDMVKPEFLKSQPAKVIQGAPASESSDSTSSVNRCPSQSQAAAKLFGGRAEAWSPGTQPRTWQMIDTGTPVTVRVPSGMVAGYIDNTTFMFFSANGPATVQNVSFLVVTCD